MTNYASIKRMMFSKSPLSFILIPIVIFMAVWGGLCLTVEKATTDTLQKNAAAKLRMTEEDKKYDEDERFFSIKSEVAHHWSWGKKEYAIQEEPESSDSKFIDTLYSTTPGYDKYLAAKNDPSLKEQALLLNDRELNHFEFVQTCDWVKATKAGDSVKAKMAGNGAGYTSANFEPYLKACGDTNLEYLYSLKLLHLGYEESLKK